MTASISQQLPALYFAIIYSWQLSCSEKSLVWKKIFILIFPGFYRFSFLLHLYYFHFLLCKAYALPWEANHFVDLETPKLNAFNQFWKFWTSFRTFSKKHTVFSLRDPLIICIYLRVTDRHLCDQGNILPQKVTKMWFCPNIKYLLEPFFAAFCSREGIFMLD